MTLLRPALLTDAIPEDRRQDPLAWASAIEARYADALFSVVDSGRLLLAAKAALAHGEWLDMVAAMTTISTRKAQRLMQIAAYEPLTEIVDNQRRHITQGAHNQECPNASTLTHLDLPDGYCSLASLTRLSPDEFHQVLADGSVAAARSARGVEKLVNEIVSDREVALLPAGRQAPERPQGLIDGRASQSEGDVIDVDYDDVDEEEALEKPSDSREHFQDEFDACFPLAVAGIDDSVSRFIRVIAFGFGVPVEAVLRHRGVAGETRGPANLARAMIVKVLHSHLSWSQPRTAKLFGIESSNVSVICSRMEVRFDFRPWEEVYDSACRLADAFRLHDAAPARALDAPANDPDGQTTRPAAAKRFPAPSAKRRPRGV